MRWTLLSLLLAAAATNAAELDPHRQWLSFVQNMALTAAGPTGMYAIQDMKELRPGRTLYLTSAPRGERRWSDDAVRNAPVRVEYKGKKVLVSGKGIGTVDLMREPARQMTLPDRLTLRLSPLGDDVLKVWLYNADLVEQRQFRGLDFYTYDANGIVDATFRRNATPEPVNYLDSRERAGVMYAVGVATLTVDGKPLDVKAYSYQKDWADIGALLLLFRDGTGGKGTYGGGRVIDVEIPKGAPPDKLVVNLNTAYSFLCAHSPFYNCPLALAGRVDAELPYGEKYPPL